MASTHILVLVHVHVHIFANDDLIAKISKTISLRRLLNVYLHNLRARGKRIINFSNVLLSVANQQI
jgi:hypothetical protein